MQAVLWDVQGRKAESGVDLYVVAVVIESLIEAVCDPEGSVGSYAVEGFRLLRSKMPDSEFWSLLARGSQLPEDVSERIKQSSHEAWAIPYLKANDCIALPVRLLTD